MSRKKKYILKRSMEKAKETKCYKRLCGTPFFVYWPKQLCIEAPFWCTRYTKMATGNQEKHLEFALP